MIFKYTWRWYGPNDRITLKQIRQAGATSIVTALHHIPSGEVWTVEEIIKRKILIEEQGLDWSVVESVPVHEDIKRQIGNFKIYIENYKQTLINLAQCNIKTVCYNFMPVLDWSRTELKYEMADGSLALSYHIVKFALFDIHILRRPNASSDYTSKVQFEAEKLFLTYGPEDIQELTSTILLGLPGSGDSYTLTEFQEMLDTYKDMSRDTLQEHLFYFVQEVAEVAEQCGVSLAIHPDDPSWSTFGLPRVLSSLSDAQALITHVPSVANGITLCTGSWGTLYTNNLVSMAKKLAHRIYFAHLRNVERDEEFNFMERYLLEGDVDIFGVVKALIKCDTLRELPIRPDHGNQMLGDLGEDNYPGYSLYGRMKGLAEIKGVEYGIRQAQEIDSCISVK